MTDVISIIRSLIIYGLCVPLAIYLGYILANPMDRTAFSIVAILLFLPLLPLLLKWHHFLLIATWNMSIVLFVLPGAPSLWIITTAISVGLTILQHILKRNVHMPRVGSVIWPLLFLTVVILLTAKLTGGISIRSLGGGDAQGGKRYIILLSAIAGFFAMISYQVPAKHAIWYVAFYLMGTMTAIVGSVAPWIPSGLHFLLALFPVENLQAVTEGPGETSFGNLRLGGLAFGTLSLIFYMLARHGMSGLLDLGERWRFLPVSLKNGPSINQPWRVLSCLAVLWIGLSGGYRSVPLMLGIIFVFLFFSEGLHKTRLLPLFIILGTLFITISLPFANQLPLNIQRSLAFLPIQVDPAARIAADVSTDWRLRIWESAIPQIPQYLVVGKGYAIDSRELDLINDTSNFSRTGSEEGAAIAGDYHNGPLSLIIPLGIFGALGFIWFLAASYSALLNYYRRGADDLKSVNRLLLAYFVMKVVFFFFIFGTFYSDMMVFTGLIGLSISINSGAKEFHAEVAQKPVSIPLRLPKIARQHQV